MSAPMNMAKRTAAGTLALAVCLSGGAMALAGAAHADSKFTFGATIAGATRYDTAVQAAKAGFTGGANDVVIVNAHSTVDGLTASYVAGVKSAPILYTDATSTPAQTAAEITALGAKNIWIVGGTTVVNQAQQDAWTAMGMTVHRFGGATRYETAEGVAATAGASTTASAFVASGDDQHLADALAIGPAAYATKTPIILTANGDTPAAGVSATLKTLGATPVVVGGTSVITDTQKTALGATVRLGGANRSLTATQIADYEYGLGFNKTTVGLVGSANANAADALVASPIAGMKKFPVLFAGTSDTNTYVAAHASSLTGTGWVFGGLNAVPQTAIDSATASATQTPSAAAYTVTASGSTTATVSTGSDNLGVIQYTVSGLSSDKVNIHLVPAANVVTDSSGKVWVKVASTSSKVASATDATSGQLVVVNGTGASGASATGVKPSNGTVTFTVNSTSPDKVVPVVYSDADDNTDLSIDNSSIQSITVNGTPGYYAAPKEAFGVGAQATWNPVAALTGTFSAYTIDSVDTTAKTISAHSGGTYATFTYGVSGSTYSYGSSGSNLTSDQFASVLGAGDIFGANYNASGPSVFTLTKDIPAAPTNVKAAYGETLNAGNGAVKVTWSPSVSSDTDSYVVTRYAVTNGVVSTSGTTATGGATSATSGGVTTWTLVDTGATTAGSYVYSVAAASTATTVAGGTLTSAGPGLASDQTAQVVVPSGTVAGAVAGAPYITSTTLADGGTNFSADAGDVIQVLFNEPTSGAATSGTAYRINDGTSAATITVGLNAVASYAPSGTYLINNKSVTVKAGQLVLVRLTNAPANFTTTSTTATVVSYPASITQITSNVVDQDESNTVNLTKGSTSISSAGSGTLASTQGAPWTETAPTTIAVPTVAANSTAGQLVVTPSAATGQGSNAVLYTYRVFNGAGTVVDYFVSTTAVAHTFTETANTAYTATVTAANSSGYIASLSAGATTHS